MKILMSGASGLLGSALRPYLESQGHQVIALSRSRAGSGSPWWDPALGHIDLGDCAGLEAVIHLAGENIGSRWTAAKQKLIRESRVEGTRLLSQALAELAHPPRVMISASATGYYGDGGDRWLEEGDAAGAGFLAEVCQQWEAATAPAQARAIRVVHLRSGMVLARQGGALAKMLPIFGRGMGGRVGSGDQYWSWVALDDAVGVVGHLLRDEGVAGAVNNVAPNPVTNRQFTEILGRVLGKPTALPVPAWAAKAALGLMAEETLLASARVRPRRLLERGYEFRFPDLELALGRLLSG